MTAPALDPLAVIALAFLGTFFTGYLLHGKKPAYSNLVLTVHKLLGVAVLVYIGVNLFVTQRFEPHSQMGWFLALLAGLLFLLIILTGALQSSQGEQSRVVLWAHRVLPYLAVLAALFDIYLGVR